MKPQPWHTLSSETLHADRWINIRADSCVTGEGHAISPYYVLNYPDWVHIVALTSSYEVILVKQYRHATEEIGLELPCGAMEIGDVEPIDAARRELFEETGYSAENFQHVISLAPNPATHSNRLHTFLAFNAYPSGIANPGIGEELTLELRLVPDILSGLQTGLIQQSMHVSSILLSLAKAGMLRL